MGKAPSAKKRKQSVGRSATVSRGGWLLLTSKKGQTQTRKEYYTLRSDSAQHTPTIHSFSIHTTDDTTMMRRLSLEMYPASYVDFSLSSEGVFDIAHCYTPPAMRGQGIARRLVEVSMLFATLRKLKIRTSCTYVSDTFMKNDTGFLSSGLMKEEAAFQP